MPIPGAAPRDHGRARGWLAGLARPEVLGAIGAAVACAVVAVRWGSFIGAGPDASGYVSQADMWRDGVLTRPAPAWALEAPWPNAVWSSAPVGYRVMAGSAEIVPVYPPGLPVLMALFQHVAGRGGAYAVVPLFGAGAVWVTFLLGRRLRGPSAGTIAAVLLLSSPPFLWFLIQPMSDVVATACWAAALLFAWSPTATGAARSGLAASIAVLVRPNLVPLAAVVAAFLVLDAGDRKRRLLSYGVTASVGPLLIALLNWYWYGSPVASGYGTAGDLTSLAYVWPNLQRHLSWLLDAQTPIILLALAAPLALRRVPQDWGRTAVLTVGFPLAVLALYAAYLVFDLWHYSRFLLPAYPALLAGAGAVLVEIAARGRRSALPAAAVCLIVGGAAWHGWSFAAREGLFLYAEHDQRFARAAFYARGLDPRAILVSNAYSGTLRLYADRDVLRWEVMDPAYLDGAIDYLRNRGHLLYFIGDEFEVEEFRRRFGGTRTERMLDRQFVTRAFGFVVYDLALP